MSVMTTDHNVSKDSLIKGISLFQGRKIIVVGDVMLDRYIMGSVERISPEAPVPVVLVASDNVHLGGAGNVARNIRSLGGHPVLLSICGSDQESELLSKRFAIEDILGTCIEDKERPTTIKTRVIAHNQQVVRIDREVTAPASARVTEQLVAAVKQHIEPESVILISDYAKGVVTPLLMDSLRTLISTHGAGSKLLVDPKPRHFSLYAGAFLLTPNAREAEQGAHTSALRSIDDVVAAGRRIRETVHCANLLITLGKEGMVLFAGIDKVWHIPAMSQTVFDVTGAGDTVISLMALSLASGRSLLEASVLSNFAAGIVVGEVGAAVVTQQRLTQAISSWDFPEIRTLL
jgi:D-glycero-beta-D-manno-heptose-7-phosphate kinase